jgi:uncharacterized protein YkwD
MKHLSVKCTLPLVISALTTIASAQSSLDSLIFHCVNEYRTENDVEPFFWSQPVVDVALNQVEYCSRVKYPFHDQIITDANDSTFQIEPSFVKRFINQGAMSNKQDWAYGENLMVVVDTDYELSMEEVVHEVVTGWINSPEHNELLLDTVVRYGAIAHKIDYEGYTVKTVDPLTLIWYESSIVGKTYWVALDLHN